MIRGYYPEQMTEDDAIYGKTCMGWFESSEILIFLRFYVRQFKISIEFSFYFWMNEKACREQFD